MILRDGTLLLAGVTLGPQLDFGKTALVLGKEGPIQAPVRLAKRTRRGLPELDKDGQPKYEPFTWKHPNATAFLLRMSSDLKEIHSVTRFGWRVGGLTSMAVNSKGEIYLCGPATYQAVSLSTNVEQFFATNTVAGRFPAAKVYLAKFNSDATQTHWVRVVNGSSHAPSVSLADDDRVLLQGPGLWLFDANGKLLSTSAMPGGLGSHLAMNPRDGTLARPGEEHTSTGREPYRNPILQIYRADQSLLYDLYHWDGPLVGLNDFRLVSDSAVRGALYDREGNLIIHGWSDGGKSVLLREPNDLATASKNMHGLGFSTTGAGVVSCSYLIKIGTDDYKIKTGTPWVGYSKQPDKPNSARINSFALATDGSICFGGVAALGLIQTGNALSQDPIGNYVAVINPEMNSLRFSSALPACGQIEINDSSPDGTKWGIGSGTLNGKEVAIFVSGATDKEEEKIPPSVNPRQEKYAGGFSDGHILVLDLTAK